MWKKHLIRASKLSANWRPLKTVVVSLITHTWHPFIHRKAYKGQGSSCGNHFGKKITGRRCFVACAKVERKQASVLPHSIVLSLLPMQKSRCCRCRHFNCSGI